MYARHQLLRAFFFLCLLLCITSVSSLAPEFVFHDLNTSSRSLSSVETVEWKEFDLKFATVHLRYNMSVPTTTCHGVTLFIFVLSRPGSFNIRNAIRNSWAKNPPPYTMVKFVVGRPTNTKLWGRLFDEEEEYDDVILYDIEDQYVYLPYKVYAGLQWQQAYCTGAKFIAKVDDDNILELNRLQFWIAKKFAPLQLQHPSIIFGNIHSTMVIRNSKSKYFVPKKVYPDAWYPQYASGPFYLMSNKAVKDILIHAAFANFNAMEDVLFTGTVANLAMVHKENIWCHLAVFGPLPTDIKCDPDELVPFIFSYFGNVGSGTKTPEAIRKKHEEFQAIKCKIKEIKEKVTVSETV